MLNGVKCQISSSCITTIIILLFIYNIASPFFTIIYDDNDNMPKYAVKILGVYLRYCIKEHEFLHI